MQLKAMLLATSLFVAIFLIGCGGNASPTAASTPTTPTPTTPTAPSTPTTPTAPPTTPPTTPPSGSGGSGGSGGTGTGGGSATPSSGVYVYTSGVLSDNIWGYRFDSNSGTLTALSGFPMSPSSNTTAHALCDKWCGASARWLTGDPGGKFLFENANAGAFALYSFTVDPATGALTQDDAIRSDSSYKPQIEPQGRFIVANRYNGTNQTTDITVTSIDRSTGHLTLAPGYANLPTGNCGNISSYGPAVSSTHVYDAMRVGCGGNSQAYGFNINSDLSLTAAPGSPYDAGYLSGVNVMHPSGKWVYIVNTANVNGAYYDQIQQYTVNADGSLSKTGTPVVMNGGGVGQTQFTPNGKFLLIPDAAQQVPASTPGMGIYAVDQNTGALTKVQFYAGMSDWLTVDPSSNWVFESPGTVINVYRIDQTTGALTKTSSAPVAVDPNNDHANSIAVVAAH